MKTQPAKAVQSKQGRKQSIQKNIGTEPALVPAKQGNFLTHIAFSTSLCLQSYPVLDFAVLVDDAEERIKFHSTISWTEFELALANTLCIPPKAVRITYCFSTAAQKASWTHIRDAEQLSAMLEDAVSAEEAHESKKSVASKKKFLVHLKLIGEQAPKLEKRARRKRRRIRTRKRFVVVV